jgi:hypothetical protein
VPRGGGTGYLLGLASQAVGIRAPVGLGQSAIDLGGLAPSLTPTVTVTRNAASRPFLNSSLTMQEIMRSGPPRADPFGVPGVFRWDVPGAFRGTSGVWEFAMNARTNEIYHMVFKRLGS